jgi:isopentenyl-diphosphate delta-isomerase
MSSNRKDDHIQYAKGLEAATNDFDLIRFKHHSIPSYKLDDIDLSTTILGKKFPLPFYINAMTGGNRLGNQINLKLAALANHFGIPFFIGSQSLAFKDPSAKDAYRQLRHDYPHLFIVGNVNPNFTKEMAQEAIDLVKANGLAIHINSIQELVMGEGDRDFTAWADHIKAILDHVDVPVIIKEVGYGMHEETFKLLSQLGAHFVDVSGAGGTSFTTIELRRLGKESSPLQDFGISTIESLKIAQKYNELTVYASGGIMNPASILKAYAFGAKAVGMARYFLTLSELPLEEMITTVEEMILDLKKIMLLLNVKKLEDISINHLYIK